MSDLKITVKGTLLNENVYVPDNGERGERYNCLVILNEGEEDRIEALVKEAIQEKWGGKKPAGLQDWTARYGDEEDRDSFEKWYIHPQSKHKPKAVRMARVEGEPKPKAHAIDSSEADDYFYPGAQVAVSVDVFCFDEDKKKKMKAGVTLGLNALCFVKHGERLSGGGVDPDEEFDGIESEEVEVDMYD
ncbi:MAG: DUF2815 family protein [Oceanococcus sp.]|nr:MAG: DUF2815 family protein [Oceanococcus sp.]